MANDKKFVVKKGLATPNVDFANGGGTISATFLGTSNTLSFTGNTGQLFSITDTMSGTIFSVNDISGIPSIEVIDTGSVKLAETNGRVAIGANTLTNYKFYVSGNTLLGNTTVNNSLTLTNNNRLGFNTLNGNTVYMIQQNDDNFVFYTTTPTGTARAVYSVYANSTSSNLQISIPLQLNNTLVANNSVGSAGQVLTSSGTGVYWGAAGAGANNATYLAGRTWETAGAIGSTVANTGAFTTLTSSGLTKIGQSVTQAAPSATDILSTAHASISGQGSNYLSFGQYDGTFAQWIQSSFTNPTTAAYNIVLQPVGGNVSIGSATASTKLYVNGHVTIANGYGLYANGTLGTAGFVLTSNGTSLYWANSAATNVANAVFATTANNALFANSASFVYGKQESQLFVANSANSSALQGATWQAPLGIGATTANTGAFTTLTSSANTTFTGNTFLRGGVVANGSFGTAGFVLTSNGTATYWASANTISGTVTSANNASYLNGKQESQLYVANAVFATTANNSLFANNADYLDGFHATYFTNATNISTGTLAEPRLPYRMNQDVRTTDSVTFANLTITGSVLVTGNVTTWSSNNLSITDNMIYLNSNSSIANPDLGFAANYNDGTYRHTGFFRDATDGVWKVFDQYLPEPDASPYIDTANLSFRIADFQANVVNASAVVINNNQAYRQRDDAGTVRYLLNTGSDGSVMLYGYHGTSMVQGVNGATYLYGSGAGSTVMTLLTGGNAGIGNTTPGQKLQVDGSVGIKNGLVANGSFGTAGYVLTSNGSVVYWADAANISGTVTTANNANYLNGRIWETAGAIGSTVANTGAFTTLTASANVNLDSATLFVDSTTNRVGIGGNTTPTTTLQVFGHMSVANGFGIYANGVLGSNGTVLTSNGSSLYWGSVSASGGGGFTGNTVSANSTIVKNQSYAVNAAAGWVTMTLPSTVATGDIFIVHTYGGNTRILNNSINIMDIGTGNDLVLENGETVWLQAVNATAVDVLFTYPAGGTSTTVSNAVFATTANNSLFANSASFVYGKQESQLSVASSNTSLYLQNRTWETAGAIGSATANTGTFTVLTASANTVLNGNTNFKGGIYANNSLGANGLVLTSNGTSVFWGSITASAAANATFATTANNSLFANSASYVYGKQESQLSVAAAANATFATTANNSLFANSASYVYGKQESQLSVSAANNSTYLQGRIWETAGAIGSTVANTGTFTVLTASANTVLNGNTNFKGGIYANNSLGANGLVLTSNGTSVFWGSITASAAANATFATTANNALFANSASFVYGKQESQLSVSAAANATFATTANNSLYAYGKQESQLSVSAAANATFATTANNSIYAYGKQESQLSVATAASLSGTAATANNSTYLQGRIWETAGAIGSTVANTGAFTTLNVKPNQTGAIAGLEVSNNVVGIYLVPKASVGAYNNLVANADNLIYFSNNTQNYGNLVIGNWTSRSAGYGIRFAGGTYDVAVVSNTFTMNANNIVNGNTYFNSGIFANGAIGANGLVLTSNGNGVFWGSVSASGGGTTTNAVTFNNGGAGAASGTTFDGSVARTISYNTVGAPSTTGTGASGTWANITANNATYAYGKQESQLSVSQAATLTTARNIGDVAFNGGNAIVPERILYKDTRATNYAPATYPGITVHLKTNGTDGLTDGGTYHGVLDVMQWSDLSGGNDHQLAFTDNNNMWLRQSTNSTAWGSWAQIVTTISGLAANATFATTANNALRFNGKQESQLSVATANNSTYAYGKQESQLSVASAASATDSTKLPTAGGTMTGTITSSVGANSIVLSNGTSNRIMWSTGGVAAPTFTSYSAGAKLVLYDSIAAASAGYAIGIEGSTMWFGTSTNAEQFKWYGGTTNYMSANTTALYHTGNITAYSSDRRLKKNITPIEEPIKKVQQIGGYTFDWDEELCEKYEFIPGQIHEHGVIAQEIQKIIPDAVTRAPFDIGKDGVSKTGENYLTVRYDRIVPLLIEAIKDQQTQIDELKELVKTLINKEQDNG